jgi:hypothetical protein
MFLTYSLRRPHNTAIEHGPGASQSTRILGSKPMQHPSSTVLALALRPRRGYHTRQGIPSSHVGITWGTGATSDPWRPIPSLMARMVGLIPTTYIIEYPTFVGLPPFRCIKLCVMYVGT